MAISNEAEFRALYDEHFDDVRRFVRRRADPPSVDDVIGETFLIAWRRRRELPADPRPWLFRTARNVLLNDRRRRRRHDSLAVRIAAQAGLSLSVVQPLADAESLIDLSVAWRRLSPADQEVLALHVWEGLPDRDAAAVLGCARATYSMRLSRARRRLGVLLGPPDAHGRPLRAPAEVSSPPPRPAPPLPARNDWTRRYEPGHDDPAGPPRPGARHRTRPGRARPPRGAAAAHPGRPPAVACHHPGHPARPGAGTPAHARRRDDPRRRRHRGGPGGGPGPVPGRPGRDRRADRRRTGQLDRRPAPAGRASAAGGAAEHWCLGQLTSAPAADRPATITNTDIRGQVASLVISRAGFSFLCLTGGDGTGLWETIADPGTPVATPGARQIILDSGGSHGDGSTGYTYVEGLAGRDVTAVTIHDAGQTITATLQGGRWTAWWPTADPHGAITGYVVVTTDRGRTTVSGNSLLH